MTFLSIPFGSSQKSGARSYVPVPAPDEETLLDSPSEKEAPNVGTFKKHKRIFLDPSFWLTTFAVLSVAISMRNLLIIQFRAQDPYTEYLEASVARPYTGLESLLRNESSPSWPLSSTHYPDFIGSTEGAEVHHALSNSSVVRLDSERTVILQHRARDYGLERCAVKVEFSPSTRKKQGHSPRVYGHIGDSPYLTLWRLEESESKAVLTPSALPTSLPLRKECLGNITLDALQPTLSSSFQCDAGSIQNLEISLGCTSEPCIMEFRLIRSPRRQGFWVVQSE